MLDLSDILIYNHQDPDDPEPTCVAPTHDWEYVRHLRRGDKFQCSHCALEMIETTMGLEYY